jgi:hypothetical protein
MGSLSLLRLTLRRPGINRVLPVFGVFQSDARGIGSGPADRNAGL